MFTRWRREEKGAVAVMVAVSMIVLIGMLVLTVDMGRLWVARRRLSTAADAAALAAAQRCALGEGSAAATAAGTATAGKNQAGDYTFTITSQCDHLSEAGYKFVTAHGDRDVSLFFAPIFGIDSLPANAEATAQWGPVVAANPVPITVNFQALTACQIPFEEPPPGEVRECDIPYPKEQFSNPGWGILDLSLWNQVSTPQACSVSDSEVTGIIEAGGWPGPQLHLNEPTYDPTTGAGQSTYDCIDSGLQFNSWSSLVGHVLTFPVVDIPTSVTETDPQTLYQDDLNCSGTTPSEVNHCKVSNADVIGFIALRVVSAANCASELGGAAVCLRVEWAPSIGQGVPGTGRLTFGLNAVRLVD
jgi:hypothetical protein